MGGLLWRLALKIGGHDMVQKAAEGPSVTSTVFGEHQKCLDDLAFVDAPTVREISILLGEVSLQEGNPARSLWPSEEVFCGFTIWQGEWSAKCEDWFQKRWDAIFSPAGAMPERQGYWKRLRRYGRRDREDWRAYLENASKIFTDATQTQWNGCRIVDIVLPETI
jgi:hypothetical protein